MIFIYCVRKKDKINCRKRCSYFNFFLFQKKYVLIWWKTFKFGCKGYDVYFYYLILLLLGEKNYGSSLDLADLKWLWNESEFGWPQAKLISWLALGSGHIYCIVNQKGKLWYIRVTSWKIPVSIWVEIIKSFLKFHFNHWPTYVTHSLNLN